METSEQQRRPTIGQSAQKLRQLGLDFDAVDLADMFWLAQFIELNRATRLSDEPPPASPPVPPTVTTIEDTTTASTEPVANLYLDDRPDSPFDTSQTTEAEEDEEAEEAETPQGLPFPVPAAPALRTRLDLARSLRPLMRKVPSRIRQELDEAATVTQIAETQLWIPVVRPQPERWLDLDLVVEDSKTTIIWERAIAELQHLMEYQGAFRTIRTWRLAVPHLYTAKTTDIQLFPRWRDRPENRAAQRPRSPRELIDPGSRRLILVLTDCTSPLWRRGIIHEILWAWAEVQPVSIVQLFPERLWTRTALSDGHIVRLGTAAPGLPSARLAIEGLPNLDDWDDWDSDDETHDATDDEVNNQANAARADDPALTDEQRLLTLPIVSLDFQAMDRWARVIAGRGDVLTPGRVFELKTMRQLAQDYQASSAATTSPRTARQRVALFRSAASETAQQLAEYMAATPVSLPVIDLLRDEFVPQARQEHVAEVLLSGLLQRCDDDDDSQCRYQFFGDSEKAKTKAGKNAEAIECVRDLLLDSVPVSRSVNVLNRLSQLIKDRAGNTLQSFPAFLTAFAESGDALGAGALPLAKVGLDVLQRLGGPHAVLARRYATVLQPPEQRQPPQSHPTEDFPFHTLEYEVAEYFPGPPLKTVPYRTPTILTILDRCFDFKTATLERQGRLLELRRRWVIRQGSGAAWGYTERLSSPSETENAIDLDMIAIPGGTFTMGAPESETRSTDNEHPQHPVTLQPFYLGRYPVTQAQWRVVAALPQVNCVLEAALSRFKGDNRPVEYVSWADATEFCARLSQHTGRNYRLPTEAEWEYACRAGTTPPFHFGDTITPALANYNGNYAFGDGPTGEYREQTTDVGSFPANAFGLYDMHGNVWEWCLDTWHENYEGAPSNGRAQISSGDIKNRVLRGGSWLNSPRNCRSAVRDRVAPDDRFDDTGFRVVCGLAGG